MNEQIYNRIKNDYYSFRDRLIKNIQKQIQINNYFIDEECYLANENWINKIENLFNEYDYKQNKSYNKILNNNICQSPEIINDFNSIINYLKNNKQFKIISKSFMESIYKKDYLKEFNYAKYYAGNNKLIIEYQIKNEKNALLLINPLNKIQNKNEIFIILNQNKDNQDKIILYSKLLLLDNNKITEILKNIDYINNIIPFEKYIILNNPNNNNKNFN